MATSLHLTSSAAASNVSFDSGKRSPKPLEGHQIRQIALAVTAACWAGIIYAFV